jgi:branched-chain amino acid transport system ATP-binding protein
MTTSALKVTDLSKRYGGVHALRGVNLEVDRGEIHGIIGPNGAGKSTFVDVISGFTPRSAGQVEVDGEPIMGRPHQLARAGIIRTFQHTSLFAEQTVSQNLSIAAACMPAAHRSTEVPELLELTGLRDVHDAPADSLSYGAQRRLAIAIALIGGPKILLLDEPAAGMNPVESAELVELVNLVARDRTVVLIEHDMSVIRALCERSTVLVDGQLLISGPTGEVLDDSRVIDVYLGVSV